MVGLNPADDDGIALRLTLEGKVDAVVARHHAVRVDLRVERQRDGIAYRQGKRNLRIQHVRLQGERTCEEQRIPAKRRGKVHQIRQMQRNNLRAVRLRVRKDGFLAVLPADAVFSVFDAQAIREVRFDVLRQGCQRVKNIRIRAAFQAERFNIIIQRPVIFGQAGDFFCAGYQRRVFQPTIVFLCRQVGNRLPETCPCAGVRIGRQP